MHVLKKYLIKIVMYVLKKYLIKTKVVGGGIFGIFELRSRASQLKDP
jgi:hypothetical protein